MQEKDRKHKFSWKLIGSTKDSRPVLGDSTDIEVYRLLQFSIRDALEERLGAEESEKIIYKAGVIAGINFCEKYCSDIKETRDLIHRLQELFREKRIGIFRIEAFDFETLSCTLTIDEDVDCSGLPDAAEHICTYDEGFIAGIMEAFSGRKFSVREVDCWCTGARTCRFSVEPID